jgi:alpha-tubulin suppressor-like RCC1 family protein
MEKPSFYLVRQILRSPAFLAQSIEQKIATLDQIEATGEITRKEVSDLINEEKTNQDLVAIKEQLNSPMVNYDLFQTIILSSNIRGKHLIALCNSSKKINEFCNRPFQLKNRQGVPVGPPQEQYLFRLLLDQIRAKVPFGKTPREAYIERVVGVGVLVFGRGRNGTLGLKKSDIQPGGDISQPRLNKRLHNIVQATGGNNHSLCLDNQGRVWVFGDNQYGQLGLGNLVKKFKPVLNPNLNNITYISCGTVHSVCLDIQGRVWCFGNNADGQLGLGDNVGSLIPTLNPLLKDIVQVACGDAQTLFLDKDGHVWVTGQNSDGELGLGDQQQRNLVVLNPYLENIVQVACAEFSSYFLDSQGRVWSCGMNFYGQLGLGDSGVDKSRFIPTLIPTLSNIVQIASNGGNHVLCLDNQGRVWAFGTNTFGELGLGDERDRDIPLALYLSNIIQIACGENYSMCLDSKGNVFVFGNNKFGQLGLSDYSNRTFPVLNPNLKNVISMGAGSVFSFCIVKK